MHIYTYIRLTYLAGEPQLHSVSVQHQLNDQFRLPDQEPEAKRVRQKLSGQQGPLYGHEFLRICEWYVSSLLHSCCAKKTQQILSLSLSLSLSHFPSYFLGASQYKRCVLLLFFTDHFRVVALHCRVMSSWRVRQLQSSSRRVSVSSSRHTGSFCCFCIADPC
jgi:hypothetical protein